MATWITHLRIAENLLDLLPTLDPERFAVGNIAPDSNRTTSALTRECKERIAVLTSIFPALRWIVLWMNPPGSFPVYTNIYGSTAGPRTVSSPPWI